MALLFVFFMTSSFISIPSQFLSGGKLQSRYTFEQLSLDIEKGGAKNSGLCHLFF